MDEPNSVEKIKLLKLWRSWIADYVIIMTTLDDSYDDGDDDDDDDGDDNDTLAMKDDGFFRCLFHNCWALRLQGCVCHLLRIT